MYRHAQILYDKAHWILETEETLEELYMRFASSIIFVDITNKPEVQPGWDYKDGVFSEPKLPTVDEIKPFKLKEINSWTAKEITNGFISAATGLPHQYDSDNMDQRNLITMLQAAQSENFAAHPVYQGEIPIRAIPSGQTEKVILQHNAKQMQTVVDDMALHIGTCKQISWQLQAAVATATTLEELEAIIWPKEVQ